MAGRVNFPNNVERKRTEAAERQAAYNLLTNEQKLERLDRANLVAGHERAKIAYRIVKDKVAPDTASQPTVAVAATEQVAAPVLVKAKVTKRHNI
jgi:hypothetical protein